MAILITGILFWSVVHLFTALGVQPRARLRERIGPGPYRGGYSLLVILGIVLMVIGWRSTIPSVVYTPNPAFRPVTLALMYVALTLFFSHRAPTDIRRVIRHPQLTGMLTWAVAHLISNGDSRSLVLFGGLGVWAIVEMIVINRRDGAWVKPEPAGMPKSFVPLVIGAVAWVLLAFIHPWIAGVPVLVRG
jgi:uncharacterized membrane protein